MARTGGKKYKSYLVTVYPASCTTPYARSEYEMRYTEIGRTKAEAVSRARNAASMDFGRAEGRLIYKAEETVE